MGLDRRLKLAKQQAGPDRKPKKKKNETEPA